VDTGREMSQENVERFIEVTEAFNRFAEEFDPDALESLIGFYDPDVNFEPRQATLQGGYSGHRGIRQWLADVVEHYGGGGHLDYVDIQDLGNRVLGLGTLRFSGRGSGIETEAPVAIIATFQNGLITHLKDYGEEDRALEAAGLSE
jgi:SnoaL-like domain